MTSVEVHRVAFGSEDLTFTIERTSRRKSVALSIGYDGIRLLAPFDLPVEQVIAIVRKKGPWLLRKQASYLNLGGTAALREFVSGETFHYLGRPYRLKVVPEAETLVTRISARGSTLVAPVPTNCGPLVRRSAVRSGLRQWYQGHARQTFPERARVISERLGTKRPAIQIVDQSKRWGSCDSRGLIRLNWRIMMAPVTLIDYVIAHEACHVLEHNHSRRFWRLLETIMPDYEDRIRRLDALGHTFMW
jgi:predicted metal-dependent hydrolase